MSTDVAVGLTTDRQTAHFFWHGVALSPYEWACISSFCRHGFDVRVWSFIPFTLPAGAVACDAASILSKAGLHDYTYENVKGSLAAFADLFRYELLSRQPGWWFDTDVICLQDQGRFAEFAQPLVAGLETDQTINIAVLKANNVSVMRGLRDEANALATERSRVMKWGELGPKLLTSFMERRGLSADAVAKECFYPIHWSAADLVLDPARRDEAAARCDGAHAYHIWNEMLRLWAVPKNVLPPTGSLLQERFVAAAPELSSLPSLPIETLRALLGQAKVRDDLGFMHHVRQLGPSLAAALRKRVGSK